MTKITDLLFALFIFLGLSVCVLAIVDTIGKPKEYVHEQEVEIVEPNEPKKYTAAELDEIYKDEPKLGRLAKELYGYGEGRWIWEEDLKDEQLLIKPNPSPKLLDFQFSYNDLIVGFKVKENAIICDRTSREAAEIMYWVILRGYDVNDSYLPIIFKGDD